jgi:hypothetical protein
MISDARLDRNIDVFLSAPTCRTGPTSMVGFRGIRTRHIRAQRADTINTTAATCVRPLVQILLPWITRIL